MSHSLDRPDVGLPEVDICPICNARFTAPEDYQRHIQSQHPGTLDADAATASTTSEETGNYLGLSLIRAPKENHTSIGQLGKPIVQWFKKHGARPEIYNLSTSEFPDGIESIAKTLSIKAEKEEEVWVLLQFYRDQAHADEVTAKMMQDESIGALMKEFGNLISQGSNLIMGGFSRLRV
jgi:uncharacterized protein YbaA (DUF1428 family)